MSNRAHVVRNAFLWLLVDKIFASLESHKETHVNMQEFLRHMWAWKKVSEGFISHGVVGGQMNTDLLVIS